MSYGEELSFGSSSSFSGAIKFRLPYEQYENGGQGVDDKGNRCYIFYHNFYHK
jgi:hypothetical protein